MNNIPPELLNEYMRERKKLPSDNEIPDNCIHYTDVLKGYYLLADYFYRLRPEEKFLFGLKNPNLLESALSQQFASFGGVQRWNDEFEVAATLLFRLIKNHAFHDGNKRISLLILLYQMDKNGRSFHCQYKDLETLVIRIAGNNLDKYLNKKSKNPKYRKMYKKYLNKTDSNILFLAHFIKKNTRKIDKRYYPVSYREFNTLLKQHNCRLENPSGGFIDLVYKVKEDNWHGYTKKTVERRFKIGFSGWTKQIGPKAVKECLKASNLTIEQGIDSNVFFKKGEPFLNLIDKYQGVLRRLKDS